MSVDEIDDLEIRGRMQIEDIARLQINRCNVSVINPYPEVFNANVLALMDILGTTSDKAEVTAQNLKEEMLNLRKSLKDASKKAIESLEYEEIKGIKFYSEVFDGFDKRELMRKAADLRKEKNTVVIFGDNSGLLVMGRSDDLNFNVIPLLEKGCNFLGGRCGGRQEFAFGGGFKSKNLKEAIDVIKKGLIKTLK